MFGEDGIYTNSTQHGISWERSASVELFYPDGREGFQVSCGIRIHGGYFRQHNATRKHSFRLLFKGIYGPSKLQYPLFGENAVDSFDTIVLRAGANDGYSWNAARYTEQYTRDEFGRLGESFNRMIDNLRRSETIRQTMTADIAHELRTPVTIIQGSLEAILDGVYQPTTETIAPIYEEILHLGGLIDDLRDLALAEAGELRLDKEPTDLVALVEQVTETVRASAEQVPDLRVEAEPALSRVSVDPKRIHQVFSNLLSNALRVTPRDGQICVELSRQGEEVELRVSDSGPGVAAEDLPHLFERFYRGDRARSRSAGGSGLGLAIVKQWVEAHGGRIWVENREIGGARFIVRLPAA